MKKAIITLFSALALTACQNNQPTNIQYDMNNTTINTEPLTARQKGLAACAFPIGNPNVNYAQYFIGNSYLNPLQPKNLNG